MAINLPSEYQRVEYIESSGTQYIDTGLDLGSNDFEIKVKFLNTQTTAQEQAIFSIWTSNYNYWNCFIHSNRKIDVYLSTHVYGSEVSIDTIYELSLKRVSNLWTLKLGEDSVGHTYIPNQPNPTTLKLFTRGDIPTIGNSNTYIKMFRCSVVVGGTLVRDFIPCYRKSDNEIGMYDLVNDVFYTNQGSGTFTKGRNLYPNRIGKVYKGTTEIKDYYQGSTKIMDIYKA